MTKIKYIIIILIFYGVNIKAEINIDFNGYVNDFPSYQEVPEVFKTLDTSFKANSFMLNITRIRFRPNIHISENSKIVIHYEIDALASKFKLPYLGSYEMTNRQAVKLNWQITNTELSDNINLIANHFVDLFYFKQFFDWGEVVLGRQIIAWGVGRVWQPTDLFNPINPANFSKIERDGADAISGKVYLGDFTDIEIVGNFREMIRDYNYGARFRTNYEEYDFSATAGHFDKNTVIGGDFAGNLFGAGFRGEGIYSIHNNDADSNYIRAIIGLDYQFPYDIYAMVEYQYNGVGTNDKSEYFDNFERLMRGEIQNLSQNYIAVLGTYLLHPLVTTSLTSITNLNDKSGLVSVTATYNVLQDLNIGLGSMFFFGEEGSEYSFYSTALYMSLDWFF